jgi:transmembrane E3 ubiquitin-protein ligase
MDVSNKKNKVVRKLEFDGVHLLDTGGFHALVSPLGYVHGMSFFLSQFSELMIAPCRVHPDIRQLSALVPEGFRNSTMYAVQEELQSRVKKFRAMADAASMYSDDEPGLRFRSVLLSLSGSPAARGYFVEEDPAHQCTFIFRGQMTPSPIPETYMRELERESAHPTGVRTARTPPSRVDGVLVSEDCAFLVKLDRGIVLRCNLSSVLIVSQLK